MHQQIPASAACSPLRQEFFRIVSMELHFRARLRQGRNGAFTVPLLGKSPLRVSAAAINAPCARSCSTMSKPAAPGKLTPEQIETIEEFARTHPQWDRKSVPDGIIATGKFPDRSRRSLANLFKGYFQRKAVSTVCMFSIST